MLRLPGPDEQTPPLLNPARPGAVEGIEEIETEDGEDFSPSGGDWKFLLILAVPALAMLGLFAWWMAPGATSQPAAGHVPAELTEETAGGTKPPVAKSLRVEIESVVKGFLAASTPDEILRHVRDPERTAPKLMARLGDQPYSAPGFREMISDSVSASGAGDLITVTVRTGDFELREIVLLESGESLKVDWESWVGWSEIPWAEFQETRPLEGTWFRAELSAVEYYNFDFLDDKQWVSYQLHSPDGTESLYGYVPRNGDLDRRIRPFEENAKVKLLLKLKFPAGARSDNQVLIEDVTGHEWVELPGAENP